MGDLCMAVPNGMGEKMRQPCAFSCISPFLTEFLGFLLLSEPGMRGCILLPTPTYI